jgi:CO/xanthine dehydrogenase Mo-binding subunit
MMETSSGLGISLVRKDAIEKVKGEAKYISDIQLPNMLHAEFLKSPHAPCPSLHASL